MRQDSRQNFRFDDFVVDPDGHALYHKGQIIADAGRKPVEVLTAYCRRPNEFLPYDDVIDEVWGVSSTATSDNINKYVSQLRQILARYEPGREYFVTRKGVGYKFVANVEAVPPQRTHAPPKTEARDGELPQPAQKQRRPWPMIAVGAVLFTAVVAAAWMIVGRDDEEEIRSVIRDSQTFESLVLYRTPGDFREEMLDKYWTPDIDLTANYDRRRIRESVKKLIGEGRRYGDESKCVRLEFESIKVSNDRRFATVRTLEEWFLAVYLADGTLQRNRTVGPYFVDYILKKPGDRWLIEKSTTGSVIRPRPQVSGVVPIGEVKAGSEFRVLIGGQDFEPETALVEVQGPGCPEVKPCRISNEILRKYAKISATEIRDVPLTLASGRFTLTVFNGDSPPSVGAELVVP